ncbi:MAG: stage II sporulation protein M [Pyrinomonadaceae bacterium]|nr:stage II sporulation protein M [Pyrinomonadaceae bacterium]
MSGGFELEEEFSIFHAASVVANTESAIGNWQLAMPSLAMAMSNGPFINNRKNAWQRLEELLARLERTSLQRLHREEVRELGRIYRRTASDLAIARAESRDPRLISYLNSLVIRAHGRIYRADAQGGERIRAFFTRELPRTFRRTWRYTALSFSVFLVFGLIGFVGSYRDTEFSELMGVPPAFRELYIETKTHWWEDLNQANQVGASRIMTNNIQVTIYTFAFGAMFGVGTLFFLAYNGANIGSVLALTYRAGFGHDLVAFMAGHGVIELSCIFIAGGAGLLIGSALIMPGDLSRADALKTRGKDAIRLMMGVAALLVLAGVIEGFISPAPIDPKIKFSIAAITGIALYAYLLLAGREETGERGEQGNGEQGKRVIPEFGQ